jgi:hypothetical protein
MMCNLEFYCGHIFRGHVAETITEPIATNRILEGRVEGELTVRLNQRCAICACFMVAKARTARRKRVAA